VGTFLERRNVFGLYRDSKLVTSSTKCSQYTEWEILAPSILGFKGNEDWSNKVKGKAVPLQAWTDPEGSRKLRIPDFVTAAQDGGKVVSLMHRPPLPPGNVPGTHFCEDWSTLIYHSETKLHLARLETSLSPLWEPQIIAKITLL